MDVGAYFTFLLYDVVLYLLDSFLLFVTYCSNNAIVTLINFGFLSHKVHESIVDALFIRFTKICIVLDLGILIVILKQLEFFDFVLCSLLSFSY